jgi:hypothetical protein
MKETEEEEKRRLQIIARKNADKRAKKMADWVLTPEQEEMMLEMGIFLAEVTGIGTNKTKEQIDREYEQRMITDFPEAPNLQGQTPPNLHDTDVEIPQLVKDALNEAIEKGAFPLDAAFVLWLEAKVAEFNGIDPAHICAHWKITHHGKMWEYYPEVAHHFTGFAYFPE